MNMVMVYGTLKAGYGNHRLLEVCTFEGPAQIKGTLYDLGAFPALSLHGNTDVHGELYEVDDATLERLDYLEGHPRFYLRQKVETNNGPAWVYTMDHSHNLDLHATLKSGVWPAGVEDELEEEA